MTNIDAREAATALNDVKDMVERVRQSQIYDLASQFLILWGALVVVGNLLTWGWVHFGGFIWIGVNLLGIVGSAVIGALSGRRSGIDGFDARVAVAFLLFFAFGLLCTTVLGQFTARQMGTFWPIYTMLFYSLAGLWFGYAFVAIGLSITALTLIGYFFAAGPAFFLWMAFVNGGGLILGGLWMRRS
jgi:hypothetical protein